MSSRAGGMISALLAVLLWPGAVGAVTTQEPAGFTVAPALQQITIQADQAETEYALQIRNHTTFDQNFRLSSVDFGSLDEQGGVAFLGAPSSELDHKYGLASWMTLEKDAVFVPMGKSVSVTVRIANRPSLAPGGHYGAVLATAVTDTGQPGLSTRVGIKQVLSSLVLAAKEGGAERALKLKSQTSDAQFWRLPTMVDQRFANTGNVHAVLRGVISVEDMRGAVVARGVLNETSGAILPESYRRYKTLLTDVGKAWMPGRYRLVTAYRYDGTDQVKEATMTIWYVGALAVWGVLLAALLAAGGLAWWLWGRPRGKRRH